MIHLEYDLYRRWYWQTWPHHVLADPEAKQKHKALAKTVTDAAMGIIGVAVLATILSKRGDKDMAVQGAVRGFTDIVVKAATAAKDIGSVT